MSACRLSGPHLTLYGLRRGGATWHFQSAGAWPDSVLKVWGGNLSSQGLHRSSSHELTMARVSASRRRRIQLGKRALREVARCLV